MTRTPIAQHRWSVASRVVAAAPVGYLLSALAMVDLALWLPRLGLLGRAEAVLTATLLSFVLHTAIVVWVFAARSATRVWTGLLLTGLCLGLLHLVLKAFP